MYSSKLTTLRMIINSVFTIANPEKIAPATKYGGRIVVCHPGITDVASQTIQWCVQKVPMAWLNQPIPKTPLQNVANPWHVLTIQMIRLNIFFLQMEY